jgi:hypothetical protein
MSQKNNNTGNNRILNRILAPMGMIMIIIILLKEYCICRSLTRFLTLNAVVKLTSYESDVLQSATKI